MKPDQEELMEAIKTICELDGWAEFMPPGTARARLTDNPYPSSSLSAEAVREKVFEIQLGWAPRNHYWVDLASGNSFWKGFPMTKVRINASAGVWLCDELEELQTQLQSIEQHVTGFKRGNIHLFTTPVYRTDLPHYEGNNILKAVDVYGAYLLPSCVISEPWDTRQRRR